MNRPYMQHGIGQLEALFASSRNNLPTLRALENELQYRQVPRAVALLAEVQGVLYGVKLETKPSPTPAVSKAGSGPTLTAQPELWSSSTSAASPAPQAAPSPTIRAVSSMSVEDAYKVLVVSPEAAWEAIEDARRRLVDLAHPKRVRELTETRRLQAQAVAKRANEAYSMLIAARRGT